MSNVLSQRGLNWLRALTGNAADPQLEARQSSHGLDLLAKPTAHLCAGVAARKSDDAEFLEELVRKFIAAALKQPGILLTRIEPERNGREDREGGILSDIIVRSGVTHLDRIVGRRVERLQCGNDLSGREELDLEFVVGHLGDLLCKGRGRSVDRVERFGKA